MSCKVILLDMYDGSSNVYISSCNPAKLSGLLEDFLFVVGDQLADSDSYSASRKLQVYLRAAKIRCKLNSPDLATELFHVDLKSATITPSRLVEQYEAVGTPTRVKVERESAQPTTEIPEKIPAVKRDLLLPVLEKEQHKKIASQVSVSPVVAVAPLEEGPRSIAMMKPISSRPMTEMVPYEYSVVGPTREFVIGKEADRILLPGAEYRYIVE